MKWTRSRLMLYSCFLPNVRPLWKNLFFSFTFSQKKFDDEQNGKERKFLPLKGKEKPQRKKRECKERKTATGAFSTRLSALWIFYSTNELLIIMFIGVGFFASSSSQSLCAFLKMFLFALLVLLQNECLRIVSGKGGISWCFVISH